MLAAYTRLLANYSGEIQTRKNVKVSPITRPLAPTEAHGSEQFA